MTLSLGNGLACLALHDECQARRPLQWDKVKTRNQVNTPTSPLSSSFLVSYSSQFNSIPFNSSLLHPSSNHPPSKKLHTTNLPNQTKPSNHTLHHHERTTTRRQRSRRAGRLSRQGCVFAFPFSFSSSSCSIPISSPIHLSIYLSLRTRS